MSVAGGVPAFDPRQLWRVVGGDVPGCPLGTLVTLSTHGSTFDVIVPWRGLAASLDTRTAAVLVSPDGGECLVRLKDGEARFARAEPGAVAPSAPGAPVLPQAMPAEFGGPHPLKYLEGSWHSPGYRSGRIRARTTKAIFLAAGLIWSLQTIVIIRALGLATRAAGGYAPSAADVASYSDDQQTLTSYIGLCIIVLAIAFLVWLSRTVDNVPPLAGGTPSESPRQSVGWWFVPIANFWKPYTIVREAWDRLSVPARPSGGYWVELWWLALLGGFLIDKVAGVAGSGADGWSGLVAPLGIEFVSSVLYLAAAVLGFLVVHEVQARADLRARALGFDGRPATFAFEPVVVAPGAFAAQAPAIAAAPVAATPTPATPVTPPVQPTETADALRRLNDLRDQGLVSTEEYAAKRIEILSRL